MSRRPPSQPSLALPRRAAALVLALGALGGCASPDHREASAPPAEAGLPAGTIAVGPDLYQVPIGQDASGCPMYRLHSPSRLVSQSIAWPKRGGGFTVDRGEADCAPAAPLTTDPSSSRARSAP